MDLEIVEKQLEKLNQETNQLLDLVRQLRKAAVFGEPLPVSIIANLTTKAKANVGAVKATLASIVSEIEK